MKRNLRPLAWVLVLALTLPLVGCTLILDRMQEVTREEETVPPPSETETKWYYSTPSLEPVQKGSLVKGTPRAPDAGSLPDATAGKVKITFLSKEEKEALRAPLVACLTQLQADADLGHIYGCALFDVTMDSVPELLLLTSGLGSTSGAVEFTVAELPTGTVIGKLSAAAFGGFEMYAEESGSISAFTSPELRDGTDTSIQLVTPIAHSADTGYFTPEYLRAQYTYRIEPCETLDENGSPYVRIPDKDTYTLYTHPLTPAEYADEYGWFANTFLRIPETRSETLLWIDVSCDEDTAAVRAEKMADALLSLAQEFVRFEKSVKEK